LSIALYGAETWTLPAVDRKHLESFEMWCWRRMEKVNWIDHVRKEEVLLRDKEQRNILHEISKRKANWIGHISAPRGLLVHQLLIKLTGGSHRRTYRRKSQKK
jgi:coenzyme F420-reducing hydrogenase alpha subunit